MKRLFLFLTAIILLQSCGDGVIPNSCILGGEIEHEVEDGSGFFRFNEEFQAYTITYHVPGTIDSQWTGVVCESLLPSEELPVEGRVTFSGEFMDDGDRFNPSVQTGGEEFFYLNITSLETESVETGTD